MPPHPFRDSGPLAGDGAALRERLAQDGYLYLKGLLDPAPLEAVRQQMLGVLRADGWGHGDDERANDAAFCVEPEPTYCSTYAKIYELQAMHTMPHSADILDVIERVLDAPATVQPSVITRIIFPGHEEMTTPPHQDFIFIQGSSDVLTAWIPYADTEETGGLGLYAGSHNSGLRKYEVALGAGALSVQGGAADEPGFTYSPMQQGDVLLFHSHTIHRGVANGSDRLRISADVRYQRRSEPMAETAFSPHLGHADWATVYQNWPTKDHQYFWKDLEIEKLAYDRTLFVERDEQAILLAEQGDARALSALQRLVGTKQGTGNSSEVVDKVHALLRKLEGEGGAVDTRGTSHMARLLVTHWQAPGSKL